MLTRIMRAALAVLGALAVLSPVAARADFIDLWADKTDALLNKAPKRGKSKLLVIPVQVDYTAPGGAFQPIDLDQLNAFFTGAVSRDVLNFNGYLYTASNNRYSADVTVAPLVRYSGCPAMLASSAECAIGRGDVYSLKSGMDFVRDVFRRTHDENNVDFRNFDGNGVRQEADGVIDGVMMVINLPHVGIAFPIKFVNTGSDLSGGTGGPLVLDGVKIPAVAIGGAVFRGGVQHLDTVIVHEFGHLLGLADLYFEHPSSRDPYPAYQGLHFSTMGDWDYGTKFVLPDAESRRALGWQDQHVISGTERLTLQPAANGGMAVKLGQMSQGRKEYFLAEVRGPVGAYDTAVADASGKPVWGLSVYHVDWSKGPKAAEGTFTERLLSCLDCDPWHPFIRNLESAGHFGLIYSGSAESASTKSGISDDQILFGALQNLTSLDNAGILGATNRYTATNWYDGTASGVSITDVVVNSDHSVTATYTAPILVSPCADVVCAPNDQCVMEGAFAGSCAPMVAAAIDGGLPTNPHNPPATVSSSGCSTPADGTSTAALWLLALPLLLVAALRRKAKA